MMHTYKNNDGTVRYVGFHICCCGGDNKKTKRDNDGYYTECSYCGLRSKSIKDSRSTIYIWNLMMRDIFSNDNNYSLVEKCCHHPDKKLCNDGDMYWYKCENCSYESEKSILNYILLNWNKDLRIIHEAKFLLKG